MGPKWDAFRAAAVIKGEDADPPPDPERIAAAMKLYRAWATPCVGLARPGPSLGPGLGFGPGQALVNTVRRGLKQKTPIT